MKYKLGLDLGSTSIGWSIIESDSGRIADVGVRIFDDGRDSKTKKPLCVARRQARCSRRLFKRHVMKMTNLTKALTDMKLFPESEVERQKLKDLNPYKDMRESVNFSKDKLEILKRMPLYALRAKALDEKLEPYEIGRILIHLGQRKGFLSNRKGRDDTGGKLKERHELLEKNMKKGIDGKAARTYGEYLYLKHLEKPDTCIRLKKAFEKKNGTTKLAEDAEFPYRSEYRHEFNAIWEKQKEFNPDLLNDQNKEKIEDILFFQRPLKDPEVGFCRFEANEKRMAKAHPLFQEFRIRQEINNIKLLKSDLKGDGESLDLEKREKLFDALYKSPTDKSMKLSAVRKLLGLGKDILINYEGPDKDKKGENKTFSTNRTALAIKNSGSNELKNFWHNLGDDKKGALINFLDRPGDVTKGARTVEDQEKRISEHLCKEYNLSTKAAQILLDIHFEKGYGNLSEIAIGKILKWLREGLPYYEACEKAGYNHSEYKYQKRNILPYYGEILKESCLGAKENPKNDEEKFGKIDNATVHVALNQVRCLVNELIRTYGKPYDISIEYARELNASTKERLEIQRRQNNNRDDNDRIREKIKKCITKFDPSKKDIEKYKLWESMKGICPYTGNPISIEKLFSPEVEVDHILPFSLTFDDSINNKIVCFRKANRDKGERTPYKAFANSPHPYQWEKILQNIKGLNEERRWRFSEDAMKKFNDMDSPIARLLNDTRYMTKLLQYYLLPIVREDGYKTVQSVRGILTSMVRRVWDLNLYKNENNPEKYRSEHYHHAIDAIVIAAIDRGQIQKVSRELKIQRPGIIDEIKRKFGEELWKLDLKNRDKISDEEITDLKKRINEFRNDKYNEIVNKYVEKPANLEPNKVKELVSKINISHKPILKNIRSQDSTVGELHKDKAYGLSSTSPHGSEWTFHMNEDGEETVNSNPISNCIYIPIFRNKKDRDEYFDAYKKWFIVEGRSENLETGADPKIKAELEQEEEEAKKNLYKAAEKAFKWHKGGNNFCLVVYKINDKHKIKGLPAKNRDNLEGEVVSNYNATIRSCRGEDISYLSYKYPTSKKIMALRRNDMVTITFSREKIESLPADDRGIENGKIKKVKATEGGKEKEQTGHIKDGFAPGLRGYLKEKITKSNEQSITVLFLVKKTSKPQRVYFIPHDVARELSPDDMRLNISVSDFEEYQVHKVHITPMGKIYAQKYNRNIY